MAKNTLLENWLPWQQRNVYLQFLNLKTLLMTSYEKSPSFKVMACSVLEFWAIYWAGGGKHPLPGANRIKSTIASELWITLYMLGGGGGDSMIPENSEYFGRTIPNDILPFLFSSHHDNLKCSRNFENLSVIKIPSSELSFWHYT